MREGRDTELDLVPVGFDSFGDDPSKEPTVGEEPDQVTTSAIIKELRRLGQKVERQGEVMDRLAAAVERLADRIGDS